MPNQDGLEHREAGRGTYDSDTNEVTWLAAHNIAERRKALVALPPAIADMMRGIAEDMERAPGGDYDFANLMRADAISLRNFANLLDQIAEQNGGRTLRMERRQA